MIRQYILDRCRGWPSSVSCPPACAVRSGNTSTGSQYRRELRAPDGSELLPAHVRVRYSGRGTGMIKRILRISGIGCLIGTVLGLCYAVHNHSLGDEGKPVLWTWAL